MSIRAEEINKGKDTITPTPIYLNPMYLSLSAFQQFELFQWLKLYSEVKQQNFFAIDALNHVHCFTS